MTSNNEKKLLTKSDINRVFWRSFTVNASFNYERQMSQGAQYALSPILQKLYPDKKELGLTEKIFTAAAIIGLLVIGGMSASMVSINPVVAIGSGDNAIKLMGAKFPSTAPVSRMHWMLPWRRGLNWTTSSTMTRWRMQS